MSGSGGPSLLEAWAYKRGGKVKSWKKRFFVLTKDRIRYYKSPDIDKQKPKGVIPLSLSARVSEDLTMHEGKPCMSVMLDFAKRDEKKGKGKKKEGESKEVEGKRDLYIIAFESVSERSTWIGKIRACIGKLHTNGLSR